MSRAKKSSRRAAGIIFFVVVILCLLLYVKTEGLQSVLNGKQDELASINAKIQEAEEDTDTIKNEIKYRETDDYIEDQARESLGLRYPDEIILVPQDGD